MRLPRLNENAAVAGIVLGMILGAIYTLLHISKRGAVRRRDLTQFGAATAELETNAAISDAKEQAKARLEDQN
jgi:gas vesicle protein